LVSDDRAGCLVEAQQLPANGLVTRAAATDLPGAHDGVFLFREANSVDFDQSGKAIVLKFQNVP
jgi:hypothetical protein